MLVPIAFFVIIQLAAAISDIRKFMIPNWMSLALIAMFPVAFYLSGLDIGHVYPHLIHFIVAFILGIVLFSIGVIGGGDTKLFAATALWMNGQAGLILYQLMAFVGGGLSLLVLGLFALDRRNLLGPRGKRLAGHFAGGKLPYGVAIAVGGIYALTIGDLFQAL